MTTIELRHIVREEIKLVLSENLSDFVKKWLFAASPTKLMGQPALLFKGTLANELFKSFKDGKNTSVVSQLYSILEPYNLSVERKSKDSVIIYGDNQELKSFLYFLEKNGTTFVKTFKESTESESNIKNDKFIRIKRYNDDIDEMIGLVKQLIDYDNNGK